MGCGGSKTDATTAQQRPEGEENNNVNPAPVAIISKKPEVTEEEGGSTGAGKANRANQQPPLHEKGYKKRIRENLRHATEGDDIDILQKNMETFEKNKLEDGGDYTDAEERMDFLKTRKDIRDACMRRHPKVLEDSIARVEQSQYKSNLKNYLDRAYYLLQHQEDQKMFKHGVTEPDQACVSEVRSYVHPPLGVHSTMTATYLIVGEKEEHLTDWSNITALMGGYGNHSLLRQMKEAEGKPVDQDVALRAKNYLGQNTLEEIKAVSTDAASFHVWASGMVGNHEGNKKKEPTTPSKPQTNTSGKGQRPGQKGDGTKPKTPSEPTKAKNDPVKDKKLQKEQENNAKQQKTTPQENNAKQQKTTPRQQETQAKKQANQVADKTVKDNKQAAANTQNAKNAKQTAQQVNSVGNKSTNRG